MEIWHVTRPRKRNAGFSLVELMVVLALVGITTGIGAVYISSGQTDLRKFARNIRFDMERAKQEALARKGEVRLEISYDPPSIDCNDDGTIDNKDRCYILYEDLNGDGLYTPAANEKIKSERLTSTIRLINDLGPGGLSFTFSPTGESTAKQVEIKAAVEVGEGCCPSRCMAVSYPLSVSHVGRVRLGDKRAGCQGEPDDSCLDASYCYM